MLQQNARGSSRGAGSIGKSLIVAQVALSLVLLLGAGLLVNSFHRLRTIDSGFRTQNVLEIGLNPVPRGYEGINFTSYRRELLAGMARLPGVISVAFSETEIPGAQDYDRDMISPTAEAVTSAHMMAIGVRVSPKFFSTMGISLLQGRDFTDADDEHQPRFAIVNRSLASRLFPGGNAVGQSVRFSVMPEYQSVQIVGVVDDARVLNLRDATAPALYFCAYQEQVQAGNLIVRTTQSADALATAAGREIGSLGHEYALHTKTIDQVIGQDLVEERVTATLSAFFAGLALMLASIGLYGLMSYAVVRRTREIGVRVAMGAQRGNILWIVLRETLTLALGGIAMGVPAGLAASRLIASMLFGVTASDLPTVVIISALLLVVSLVAGYLPAFRASNIDPIHALRTG